MTRDDLDTENPQGETVETDETLEELIEELRDLADQAGERAEEREVEADMSDVNTKHMAMASYQGMEQAFQQAWKLAISKRDEPPEEP